MKVEALGPIAGERDLWRLWLSRRLPMELRTREGRGVRVLFPGVANSGAGPDFLGAQIAFDGEPPRRGDVELHLRATSWKGHGHDHDQRYNGVILHVVLEDDGGPAWIAAGLPIPVLALGPLLADLGEPRTPASEEGPCRNVGAPRAEPARVRAAIRAAGQARFEARASLWEGELAATPVEDCMLRSLLRCAGLGGNGEACAALAQALDGATLEAMLQGPADQRSVTAAAALLGMAGLLELGKASGEEHEAWSRQSGYWPGRPLDARQWRRFRIRPANLPEARLRVVAAVLAANGLSGLTTRLAELVDRPEPSPVAELLAPLLPEGAGAGRSWALESWTNTLLPFLAAAGPKLGRAGLGERAARLYAGLPGGGDNRVLTRMRGIAGLDAEPSAAIAQQGLLHIWADCCSRQECARCPLARVSG
ncbi:MAG TPA: DUF2851 family protein [Chloroflexota bacterium]|nr:DUF2851 family protein [Chloroflexota bacterium]